MLLLFVTIGKLNIAKLLMRLFCGVVLQISINDGIKILFIDFLWDNIKLFLSKIDC